MAMIELDALPSLRLSTTALFNRLALSDLKDLQPLHQTLGSAQDVDKADKILGHILELFADAEGVSKKFKNRASQNKLDLLVYDTMTDLESTASFLHNKMRDLSIKRQSQTNLQQKVKWALYQEKHFTRLIEDVTDLVNDLVELFPAAQVLQKELCKVKVSEMGVDRNLLMLKAIAEGQDKLLQGAIAEATRHKTPSSHVSFSGSHNSEFQLAHNTGTISNLRWSGST